MVSVEKTADDEAVTETSLSEVSLGPVSADRSFDELKFWTNCIGTAVLMVDKDTLLIRHANDCATTFFQKERSAFINRSIGEIIGDDAEQMLTQIWSRTPLGKVGEAFIIPGLMNGEHRMLMIRLTRIMVEGELLRLFTFTDAPPHGSVALAGWQDNMMQILNWFPFGFEIADHDDQIHFANVHCRKLFGYHQHELESIEDWWRLAYPDPAYRELAKRKWHTETEAARVESREMTPFDLDVTTAFGDVRTIQLRHRTIGSFNVNLFLDVTRERAYERELKILASTDPLTGVLNRRQFFEDMGTVFRAEVPLSMAVLMLDLDHFKAINDAHGHAAGDLVLQEFARRCDGLLRSDDRLARVGGEEFAILLPATTLESAASLAERLRLCIESRAFEIFEMTLDVTISIGGTCRLTGDTIDRVMLRADKALYEAKHTGRNQIVMMPSFIQATNQF